MNLHANAKLGLAARQALVCEVERGRSLRATAAAFNVSPATAHRWWHRWQARRTREPRSEATVPSRPRHRPRQLTPEQEAPILRARRETNLGPGRLSGLLRRARSTIWKVLARHGLSRRRRGQRQSHRRYEWSRPGALLHMDVKKLARFSVPGHRVTGDRRTKDLHRGIGYDHLHCVVDDHSSCSALRRAAPARGRRDERAHARARPALRSPSSGSTRREAVMTDNAMVYRCSTPLRGRARRRRRPPHPHAAVHAALERQGGTLHRHARCRSGRTRAAWRNSSERARSLLSFVRYYNRRRPQSSLGDRPPLSRVHNLCGQDS